MLAKPTFGYRMPSLRNPLSSQGPTLPLAVDTAHAPQLKQPQLRRRQKLVGRSGRLVAANERTCRVMLQKPRLLAQAYRQALNASNAGAHWTHALHPLAQPHAASTRTTHWSTMQSCSRLLFLRRMRSQEKATSCAHPLLTRHFQLPCTSPQAATGGGAVKSRSRDGRLRDDISP